MVVTAPPGTGKTTFVPPLVANLQPGRAGLTLLTQPRRVAVRAAASRIAHLDGDALGGAVGFTVRGERRVSAATRIEALTPGVLLRRLLADPELPGVGAVILDEVHERSVDGDLLLGMLAEVRALRDDLVLVAMSATLDATRTADLLGAAGGGPVPVVEVPSALHPLRIAHAPFDGARFDDRGVTRGYLAHVAEVARAAQRAEGTDALVFLPGAGEVDEVVRLLRAGVGTNAEAVDVLPLHGRLPAREQDRAVRGRGPAEPPRIVVSTSLAESSLTVPGVRLVVDSGLSREVRRDRARGMAGLVTVSASRASAEQRAGRAARQGAGVAIRVYSEADFARMPAASAPEISSADLTDTALLLAAWGTPGGAGLALPTPPPAAAMRDAVEVLRALELVDASGRATRTGARVALLPVGVREARALVSGSEFTGDPAVAAEVVAAMSDDHREPGADLPRLLRELRAGRAPGADRWRRETRRLGRIAAQQTDGIASPERTIGRDAAPGVVLALARPDWIARRTGADSRTYLLASGTRAALPEGSGLVGAEWIAVREVQRSEGRAADGTGAVIRLAAPLAEEDALGIGASLACELRSARIDDGRLRVRVERRLGAILRSSTPVAATPSDVGPAFAAHLRDVGLGSLSWSERAAALRGRLGLLHRELGAPWPAVEDAALLERLDDWLGADLARLRPGTPLGAIDLVAALRRILPWPEAGRLDELAPERLAVPSGNSARIDYPEPGSEAPPVVEVKLQEMFGLDRTPRLVDGRVPILFRLLSPARRPLATTSDLTSFWNGPYRDVRAEMRGRYPKHPWPEDPWTAPATGRVKHPRR
ncbi:ATP-dependent helicase HrpB [Leucobacter zeae]|nr:ATP-dependent helicase HrpB [Leucobacter zeae]